MGVTRKGHNNIQSLTGGICINKQYNKSQNRAFRVTPITAHALFPTF